MPVLTWTVQAPSRGPTRLQQREEEEKEEALQVLCPHRPQPRIGHPRPDTSRAAPGVAPGSPRRPGGRCPLTVCPRPTLSRALRLGWVNLSWGSLPPRASDPGGVSLPRLYPGLSGGDLAGGVLSLCLSELWAVPRPLHPPPLTAPRSRRLPRPGLQHADSRPPRIPPWVPPLGSLPPPVGGREAPPRTGAEAAGPDASHARSPDSRRPVPPRPLSLRSVPVQVGGCGGGQVGQADGRPLKWEIQNPLPWPQAPQDTPECQSYKRPPSSARTRSHSHPFIARCSRAHFLRIRTPLPPLVQMPLA